MSLSQFKSDKAAIRKFMRLHYTNDRLVELLAHAKSGRLTYSSCCCFIGVATADHEDHVLMPNYYAHDYTAKPSTLGDDGYLQTHLKKARDLEGAREAEHAFNRLAGAGDHWLDKRRQQVLIPMIKAEIARRMALVEAKSKKKPATRKKVAEFA